MDGRIVQDINRQRKTIKKLQTMRELLVTLHSTVGPDFFVKTMSSLDGEITRQLEYVKILKGEW